MYIASFKNPKILKDHIIVLYVFFFSATAVVSQELTTQETLKIRSWKASFWIVLVYAIILLIFCFVSCILIHKKRSKIHFIRYLIFLFNVCKNFIYGSSEMFSMNNVSGSWGIFFFNLRAYLILSRFHYTHFKLLWDKVFCSCWKMINHVFRGRS